MTTEENMLLLPVLPLRDVVVFPGMVIPLLVGREKSIRALEVATEKDNNLVLVTQRVGQDENPLANDLYAVGCLSHIMQKVKLADGTIKVLVEGGKRISIKDLDEEKDHLVARVADMPIIRPEQKVEARLRQALREKFDQFVRLNANLQNDILQALEKLDDLEKLTDVVTTHLTMSIPDKQEILETNNLLKRVETLLTVLQTEIEMVQVGKQVSGRVKEQMEKSQREYYLHEQMKAIQKELGDNGDAGNEFEELTQRIEAAGMTEEAKKRALDELKKLRQMSPMSAEATVVRNYIDWLLQIPWNKRSRTSKNLPNSEKILNDDHFGLEKVKERILEYLAVQQRVKSNKGAILCLVGPPGVGKTSLGQSIARATNRKFIRMSLGGVRDEAEIRGHRRTYIGSMPGKILQNMAKAKTQNPLFMLDEIDKMSMDFRGDPSSALLEVLDPEQNHAFTDHYLEVEYDLSRVMFIATANTLDIPYPLLDRMEVIRISGYTEEEKKSIAENYLVNKQKKFNGIKNDEVIITAPALLEIIRNYTHEAGVRGLERQIAKIYRKSAKKILLSNRVKQVTVRKQNLSRFLGVPNHRNFEELLENNVGEVTGLAWTEFGGEVLRVEVLALLGKGKQIYTGHLGEVMQESIQAATSVVRRLSTKLAMPANFHEKKDLHIHFPEGATPKDGPSAGISVCIAMISALTNTAVRGDVAMTGEITLSGRVLPIGGLKEKLLAAVRCGIKTVLIPEKNKKDLSEIQPQILKKLKIVAIQRVEEALEVAMVKSVYKVSRAKKPSVATKAVQKRKATIIEPTTTH